MIDRTYCKSIYIYFDNVSMSYKCDMIPFSIFYLWCWNVNSTSTQINVKTRSIRSIVECKICATIMCDKKTSIYCTSTGWINPTLNTKVSSAHIKIVTSCYFYFLIICILNVYCTTFTIEISIGTSMCY